MQQEAIELATLVESIAPRHGCHVALTGGCLYKAGDRKDCDLIIYRIRQVEEIDILGLINSLAEVGIETIADFGFCHKCSYKGKPVDILFPECIGGDYQDEQLEMNDPINL